MTEVTFSSTHPPLPPTTEENCFSWLRLLRSRRVGVVTFYRLLREHGSGEAALEALPKIASDAGMYRYEICPAGVVEAELRKGRQASAQLISFRDPLYPQSLKDLADAPPLLWVKGNTSLLSRPMIALVGARNASSLGTRMTRALATGLTKEGFVVVSGLARGVDTAAHTAALAGGTIAVQAGGVDVIYPAENTQLAEEIAMQGLRISEQPMGLVPQARHFPTRNRIISGLAQAVVVVEAATKSGSLITARNALDQGRDVLAVPGHPFDARAGGCNMLIRDGATLIRSVEDVLEAVAQPTKSELPIEPPQVEPTKPLRDVADLHSQILSRLGPSPMAEDQLIRDVGVSSSKLAPALLDLELDGQVERQAGGLLSLSIRPN